MRLFFGRMPKPISKTQPTTRSISGAKQARTYIGELRRAIELLATTALQYPSYDEVYPGLRRKRSGMHHIYFLVSASSVEVLNILHVQSDPGLHITFETWDTGRDDAPD